jgi:DNA polymerase-1
MPVQSSREMNSAARLPEPGDPRTLYVVDISGYLFRAFHALPPLSNARGEPTNAVLGVTTMLQKLVADQRPAMLALAFDSRTPSFRHARYAQYKATRTEMPSDLRPQLARVNEVIEAFRFPVFREEGMEADDLIASLVKCALARELSVVIVSSDKDLMQLVGERVWMFDTMRNAVFGPAEVEQKLGVPPGRVRDYLALVGDSSDNVPGVPSIGPKTAAALLNEHGDLDRLYAQLERVERKAVKQKLQEHRDQAFLSRELVSLKDDCALAFDPQALALPEPDLPRLHALFDELAFTRLLAQLPAVAAAASAATPVRAPMEAWPVQVIASDAELGALAEALAQSERFALMCLMEGAHPVSGQLVGLAFAFAGRAAYVPVGHSYLGCPEQLATERVLSRLGSLLEDASREKVSSDAKRDLMALAALGVRLRGVAFDTMLASYLIDPERHSHRLSDIARFELDQPLPDSDKALLERRAEQGALSGNPVDATAQAGGRLTQVTLAARDALRPRLEAAGCAALLADMELPLARVLADVELTGVRVDTQQLLRLSGEIAQQVTALEQRCRQLAGHEFNVGSPRQLEAILFDELKLPVVKRTKTARSTDADVLEELAMLHDLPATILEHRMLSKLKSTYLDALPRQVNPKTRRIHTDFRQAVAATGRLSSTDPNLQNIPIRTEIGRSIRHAFIARDGWQILSADYSQIELRVLAHLSRDRELIAAFTEGADVHHRTARAIFGVDDAGVTREMRGQAKTVNYAVIYGQTQFALARNLRIERSQAASHIKAFFQKYEGVAAYMEAVVEQARTSGQVRTLCGRVRMLPDLLSRDRMKRQAAERIARNTPIQGSAADIIKLAMIAIHDEILRRGLASRMLLSVHDELVFEAPPEERAALEQLVCERMEQVIALDVPLVVDRGWGQSWGTAH